MVFWNGGTKAFTKSALPALPQGTAVADKATFTCPKLSTALGAAGVGDFTSVSLKSGPTSATLTKAQVDDSTLLPVAPKGAFMPATKTIPEAQQPRNVTVIVETK